MVQNPIQVRVQLVTPVLIVTLLMLIAWTLTQWSILGHIIQEERSRFTSLMVQEWQTVVDTNASTHENLLYQISRNKNLQSQLLQQNRQAALDTMGPLLDYYQQTYGVRLLYLHSTEGVVFARAHEPDQHGDRIQRATLLRAMETGQTVSGIETSEQGKTMMRTVQPWFQDGQLVGYLEVGTPMQTLVDTISRHQHVDVTLLLKKSLVSREQWLNQAAGNETHPWERFDDYLVEATTRDINTLDLQPYFSFDRSDLELDKQDLGRITSQIPISNIDDLPIGHLLMDKDFSWLVDEFSEMIQRILAVFAAVILFTCLLYAWFAKRLNDQINFNYRALNTEIESRKAAERTLKEHQKGLEEAVTRRTRELNVANHKLKEDIELREQTERQLAESTQKYRALFNGSTDMILVLRDNRIIDANVAAHGALEFGTIAGNSLNTLDQILKCQGSTTQAAQWMREAKEEGVFRAEMDFHGREQRFPVDVLITYINEDESSLFLVACRDISERKAAQAKVEYQALYDPLTDLPNRRLFMEELQRATQLCRRQNKKGAILFIDLDHFKNINDTLGHSVGDNLLEVVAGRLKHCMRAEDTVARFGGDEFVVIIPCCGDDNEEAAQSALAIAHKIRDRMAETCEIGEHQLHITPSVGIAIFPKLNETTEDILKQADAALYGAKGDGRNTVRFFEPRMQKANEERLILEKELRKALERDQMFIALQTKHDMQGKVIGSECLIRWKHPDLGMVSPFHFISIAEETGYITPIGNWVIEQVARWMAYCEEHKLPQAYSRVAINLSPLQLFQPNFVNDLWGMIQKYGVSPHSITLEITENVLIKDFESVIKLLQKLKDLGFLISIDDFGTGYSSLRYLRSLPIDELKIDQSFVREIHTNANDRAIAETIISMARHLNLKVVAEGVENIEQFSLLKQLGCDRYQGYYFARPVPTGELLDKIRASA